MNVRFKKKLVAVLLLVCCLLCGWLFFTYSPTQTKSVQDFTQIDSLIQSTLASFNIDEQQVSHYTTTSDSSFNRKTFVAAVPVNFAEAKLHLSLKHTFHPYGITVPATVLFPGKNLRIHIYYKNTVIRTLILDPEDESDNVVSSLMFINMDEGAGATRLL